MENFSDKVPDIRNPKPFSAAGDDDLLSGMQHLHVVMADYQRSEGVAMIDYHWMLSILRNLCVSKPAANAEYTIS